MELDIFYESCFKTVVRGIRQYLEKFSELQAVTMTGTYEEYQGEEGLIALAGFIDYAEAKQMDSGEIALTILHDVMGCRDQMMLPRSSGYALYANMDKQELAHL